MPARQITGVRIVTSFRKFDRESLGIPSILFVNISTHSFFLSVTSRHVTSHWIRYPCRREFILKGDSHWENFGSSNQSNGTIQASLKWWRLYNFLENILFTMEITCTPPLYAYLMCQSLNVNHPSGDSQVTQPSCHTETGFTMREFQTFETS